jgi:hypothetical protein
MLRSILFCATTALAVSVGGATMAQEVLAARSASTGTKISFTLPTGHYNATLSVAGPDGRVITASARQGSPTIDISGANVMGDGIYTWQLTAATPRTKLIPADDTNGRDNVRSNMRGQMAVTVGAASSGTFLVQGGKIVDTSKQTEAATR